MNDSKQQTLQEDIFVDDSPTRGDPMFSDVAVAGGVPIPIRRIDMSQIRDFEADYTAGSPMDQHQERYANLTNNPMWSSKMEQDYHVKMEEDISDLIPDGLGEDADLLNDLNFDDLLPGEFSCIIDVPQGRNSEETFAASCNSFESNYAAAVMNENLLCNRDNTSSPLNIITTHDSSKSPMTFINLDSGSGSPNMLSPNPQKLSPLHELLMRKDYGPQSVPGPSHVTPNAPRTRTLSKGLSPSSSRLSSSAPTHLGLEQIWERREPRKHLLSTGSLIEAGSTSSISTSGIMSPEAYDLLDEIGDSDDDSDQYDEFSSDAESSDGEGGTASSHRSKKERYFWQYNVQAKGPKGQRLVLKTQAEDPHILNEIQDPVFSPDFSMQGIKHSGKARKGDGNDLTPNPKKLQAIGRELDKLNRVITDMTPVSELPFNARPNTRKEKNKLASRACRLKKKAQHEANKIKLLGLEHEHKRLLAAIHHMKQLLASKIIPNNNSDNRNDIIAKNADKMVKYSMRFKVAGQTTEFVNKVLEKSKSGVANGGLDELNNTSFMAAHP